jgi:sugar lactone lactonase YvrE
LKTFKIITLLCIAFLSSCVKEDVEDEVTVEPVKPSSLTISSIKPTFGPKNTTVTIIGTDFSSKLTDNKVTINGLDCSVNNASPTSLNVTIPRGAGTGNIVVSVGGNTQQGPVFTYEVTPAVVTTIAGNGVYGFADGIGINAQIGSAQGIAIDTNGNIYLPEYSRLRKISPTGVVSTIAGNGSGVYLDGTGVDASFIGMGGVTIDAVGNLYVSDGFSLIPTKTTIRKITSTGIVTTLAGGDIGFAEGNGIEAKFGLMRGVAIDSNGNLYVADASNNKIRKITPSGKVTTFAGSTKGSDDGVGTEAKFNEPAQIAFDPSGNLYVADSYNFKVRKITPTGVVTTLAGSGVYGFADGIGSAAEFRELSGIAVDTGGNVYVSDRSNHRIRKISATGMVTTLAGDYSGYADGAGNAALFYLPDGITVDKNGVLYVADGGNNRIRKITQD